MLYLTLTAYYSLFISSCKTYVPVKYNLPPVPERPVIKPLTNGATTYDMFNSFRQVVVYCEKLEVWKKEVILLVGDVDVSGGENGDKGRVQR